MPGTVLGTELVPLERLRPYHRNARRGNVDVIVESLRAHGQYKPITVNRGTLTGRPGEVLAGNHTLQGAARLEWPSLLVSWVDVDEDEATAIVLADNRTSDLGTYDSEALVGLLRSVPELEGTGYSGGDLDKLIASVEGAPGSADFVTPGEDQYEEQYGVIVLCGSDAEQEETFNRLQELGFRAKVVTV